MPGGPPRRVARSAEGRASAGCRVDPERHVGGSGSTRMERSAAHPRIGIPQAERRQTPACGPREMLEAAPGPRRECSLLPDRPELPLGSITSERGAAVPTLAREGDHHLGRRSTPDKTREHHDIRLMHQDRIFSARGRGRLGIFGWDNVPAQGARSPQPPVTRAMAATPNAVRTSTSLSHAPRP